MPLAFAERLKSVSPSVTLAMNARAAELRQRGVDVYAFGVGEPDFEPPAHVIAAAKAAIDKGASKYTAVTGIAPLKQAICDASARARGFSPTPQQVTVTVGAKHALFNLAIALYEPGDEVILPSPCWVSYPEQVRMMGATPVIVATEEASGWRMSAAALEAAITPRTKAVILCTPSNPTGAAYPERELRALLEVLARHDVWLIVDEIYAELVYDGFRHTSPAHLAPELLDRMVIVDGVSKTYAMTGWRIGFGLAPKPVIDGIVKLQSHMTSNPTSIAQKAGVEALTGPQDAVGQMLAEYARRRRYIVERVRRIPGVSCQEPMGAFYIYPNFGQAMKNLGIASTLDLATQLLAKAHVALVPGEAFGTDAHVRISYATSMHEIERGLQRIDDFVQGKPAQA